MKKMIATKQMKRWQFIDRLALIVPLFAFLYLSVGEIGRQLWETVMGARDVGVTLAAVLFLSLGAVILSLPVILLWRAVSHAVKKAVIRNATFLTLEDFDYYREKLDGISPTTISLLMDLKIEAKKDVAALLLQYVKLGAASLEGGTVRVLNSNHPNLLPSDRTLLELIAKGQVQPTSLGEWKQQAITEAVQSGNLNYGGTRQRFDSVSRSCVTGCLSGCLFPILLILWMVIGAFVLVSSGRVDAFERFMDAAPKTYNAGLIDYFLSSSDMVITGALMLIAIIPLFVILWLPIAAVLRMVFSISHENVWLRRTEEGELLTAQISGIKNFLRDYSNLSMTEKEQLLLWEDFLIYAVVLEENERIVEDIFSMKNLRYGDFILF